MNPTSRWNQTWMSLDSAAPPGLIDELISAYGQPQRAYHTLQHLTECFHHLDECPLEPVSRGPLELALWFHDAIYDTRASDNEERSASWSRTALSALPPVDVATIERLILVTKHDASPESDDEKLLLDIDLSILGSTQARFGEYEAQIRREYSWVPEDAFRTGRSKILRAFLERPFIYYTGYFHDALERQARANLESALAIGTLPRD